MMPSRGLRTLGISALSSLGIPSLFTDSTPRILLYHGVTDAAGDGIFNYRSKFITVSAFAKQIRWLKSHFAIQPLQELVEDVRNGTPHPRALAITFDDGYANNYNSAFPILRDEGVPATFFVTTGFISRQTALPVDRIEYAVGHSSSSYLSIGASKKFGTYSRSTRIQTDLLLRGIMKSLAPDDQRSFLIKIETETGAELRLDANPEYAPMSWEQMREMEACGMTFAAHTHTHPILSRLSSSEAASEIILSRDIVKRNLTNPLSIFAYPNGGKKDFTNEVIETLRGSDFTAAVTTEARTVRNTEDMFRIPRFTMDGTNDLARARLIVSGLQERISSVIH